MSYNQYQTAIEGFDCPPWLNNYPTFSSQQTEQSDATDVTSPLSIRSVLSDVGDHEGTLQFGLFEPAMTYNLASLAPPAPPPPSSGPPEPEPLVAQDAAAQEAAYFESFTPDWMLFEGVQNEAVASPVLCPINMKHGIQGYLASYQVIDPGAGLNPESRGPRIRDPAAPGAAALSPPYTPRPATQLSEPQINSHTYPRQCHICGKTLKSKYLYNRHQTTHLNNQLKGFRCPYCPKRFGRKDSLKRHMNPPKGKKGLRRCCGA